MGGSSQVPRTSSQIQKEIEELQNIRTSDPEALKLNSKRILRLTKELEETISSEDKAAKKQASDKKKAEEEAEKQRKKEEKAEAYQELDRIFTEEILPITFCYSPTQYVAFLYVRKNMETWELSPFQADNESLTMAISHLPLLQGAVKRMQEIYPGKADPHEALPDVLKYIINRMRVTETGNHIKAVPYCSNSKTEKCQHYLDIDSVREGPTPAWDQFLSRCEMADEFLAFIWSIFDVRDRGRQLCFVRDAGGGGKSAVTKALFSWLGEAATAFDSSTLDNSFGAESRVGKRLLIDADSKQYGLIVHEQIHKITGGDKGPINPKNKKMYMADLYAKCLVMSNYYPKISSDINNERSRLLFIKVNPRQGSGIDLNWEQGLIDERDFLLFKAREAYGRVCHNHQIKTDKINWAEVESNDLEVFFEFMSRDTEKTTKAVVYHPQLKIKRKELEAEFFSYVKNMRWTDREKKFIWSKIERYLSDRGIKVSKHDGNNVHFEGIGYASDIQTDPII